MTPLLLTSLAVALPSQLGLMNVGGEGQLYMGAWSATAATLSFSWMPAWQLLPLMTAFGFAGGALWALFLEFCAPAKWSTKRFRPCSSTMSRH